MTTLEWEHIKKNVIIVGGKIYARCSACGKIVRINKPIIGDIHVCVSPKED